MDSLGRPKNVGFEKEPATDALARLESSIHDEEIG